MAQERRVISDCRKYPEAHCSLTIAGTEEEVIQVGIQHAVEKHGYQDTPEVREKFRAGLQEEKELAGQGQAQKRF